MTDTPVTDTSLEALKLGRMTISTDPFQQQFADGWNSAIDHIAELIRTGRIRLGGGE